MEGSRLGVRAKARDSLVLESFYEAMFDCQEKRAEGYGTAVKEHELAGYCGYS